MHAALEDEADGVDPEIGNVTGELEAAHYRQPPVCGTSQMLTSGPSASSRCTSMVPP